MTRSLSNFEKDPQSWKKFKHKQIFSSGIPDLKMLQLLASLATKNTDSLIGAVARVLEDEGIHLMDSTAFLRPLLPEPGVLTNRGPSDDEKRDLDYGFVLARELGRLDVGQSVAVADSACVALEAMEGTDAIMARAASLVNGRPLRIVKLAKPKHDFRFDAFRLLLAFFVHRRWFLSRGCLSCLPIPWWESTAAARMPV